MTGGERKLPYPIILYPIRYHVSIKMDHGMLYYFGIAFVSLGIVLLARAAWYFFRRNRHGK